MASSTISERLMIISQQYTISTNFILLIFGIIGNSINLLVFTQLKIFHKNQCIFYFIIESIIDTSAVIYFFILRLLIFIYGSDLTPYSSLWCQLRTIIGQTILLIQLFVICFISIDQYLFTSSFVYLRQKSTLKLARYLVIISLGLSFIHSLSFGVFFYGRPPLDCILSYSILVTYYSYIFYPVLSGILPNFIAGLFSLLAYRNVRHLIRRQLPIARRRLDRQLTQFALTRVVCLIIFLTPVVIYRIYAINTTTISRNALRLAMESLVQSIIYSLFYLNYAANFYIFWTLSSRYRRQVKYILTKKLWHQWKQCFISQPNQIDPANPPPVPSIELQ